MELGVFYFFLILTAYMIIPFITILSVYWFFIRKGKMFIYITEAFGDNLRRIIHTKKRFPLQKGKYHWKDRDYIIRLDLAILDESNRPRLFYDKNNSDPIVFKDYQDKQKNSNAFRTVLQNKALSDIAHGYKDKMYMLVIVGLVIGIIAMAVFYQYQMNTLSSSYNNQLVALLNQTRTVR